MKQQTKYLGYPAIRHNTCASAKSKLLSQIVPHCPFMLISTLPSYGPDPPTNLIPVKTNLYNAGFC